MIVTDCQAFNDSWYKKDSNFAVIPTPGFREKFPTATRLQTI